MSFICHIHNYTEYNQQWNVFSAFNPSKCAQQWAAGTAAPGEQFGVRCLAQGSHLSRGQFEPTTSAYKSEALSIRATTAPWWWWCFELMLEWSGIFQYTNMLSFKCSILILLPCILPSYPKGVELRREERKQGCTNRWEAPRESHPFILLLVFLQAMLFPQAGDVIHDPLTVHKKGSPLILFPNFHTAS